MTATVPSSEPPFRIRLSLQLKGWFCEPEVGIEPTTYRLRERTDVVLTSPFAPAVLLSVQPRVLSFRFVQPRCFTIGPRMVLKILKAQTPPCVREAGCRRAVPRLGPIIGREQVPGIPSRRTRVNVFAMVRAVGR
jgi:hypothetical protein